jgi:hypothetical protein
MQKLTDNVDVSMSQREQHVAPAQTLMQLILGKNVAKALATVAELGIADMLVDGPTPIETLAREAKVSTDGLYRIMRLLAAIGVFAEPSPYNFGLTPVSQLLRSDEPRSMRAMMRMQGSPYFWAAWNHLSYSVRTGRPAFDEVFGMHLFDYLGRNPDQAEIFDTAMTNFTTQSGEAVARAYDFSGSGCVVDVGGGHGALLSAILDRYPDIRGVLFDRSEVIARANMVLAKGRHPHRIDRVSGDFFDQVPAGGDAYILKHIIHDWDDDRCVKILDNCRNAMAAGGRIVVLEHVITDGPESLPGKLFDLDMMVMTPGGRERTEAEFRALFGKAGLKLTRLIPTESMLYVLEARSADA